jgi:hypothetical protein
MASKRTLGNGCRMLGVGIQQRITGVSRGQDRRAF